MRHYTLLLYDNDPRRSRHFSGIAAELGMTVTEAQTPDQAREAFAAHFFEMALVNINLPPIEIPPETRRLLYGEPDERSGIEMIRLRPDGVLAAPFKPATTHHMLVKISGLLPPSRSLPSLFIEIDAFLQERLFRLNALLKQPEYHLPLNAFPDLYCGRFCDFAIPSSEIPPEESEKYAPLGTTTAQGHMVCQFKKDCRLFSFAAAVSTERPHLASPAAGILTMPNPDCAAASDLARTIKASGAACQSWVEQLINFRRNLCQQSCHAPDDKGVLGTTIKKQCCGYGCVLDNYFDLEPQKEMLTPMKVLVYDHDTPETKALIFLCRNFSMAPERAQTSDDAKRILSDGNISIAFINPNLEHISIPDNTRVVIVDEISIGMIARSMSYRPVGFIPNPFDIAQLSMTFTKTLNIPFSQEAFPALLSNIEMELNTTHISLNSWLLEEAPKYNIDDSVKYYCENQCPIAVSKSSLKDADLAKYYLLNPFTRRGPLYCAQKPRCKLWEFHAQALHEPAQREIGQSPADFLRTPMENAITMSLLNQITATSSAAVTRAEAINALRQNFCIHVCDKKRADFQIKKGDILFSTLDEILTNNVFVYCRERDCPLMQFFAYFRRVMV